MSHSHDSSLTAQPLGTIWRGLRPGETEGHYYASCVDAFTGATREFEQGKPAKPNPEPSGGSV